MNRNFESAYRQLDQIASDKIAKLEAEVSRLQKLQDAWEHVNFPREVPISYSSLLEMVRDLEKDRDMWKANHDNQRNLKAAIIDRLNCRDRAQKVIALIDRIQQLETAIKNVSESSLVEHEGSWNKCHFNVEEQTFKQLVSLIKP